MGDLLKEYWSFVVTVGGLLVHIGMTRQKLADMEGQLKATEAKVENVRLIEQQLAQHSLAIVDLRNDQHESNKAIVEIKIMLGSLATKIDHVLDALEKMTGKDS